MRCVGAVFIRCWRQKIPGLHLEIRALMEHIFYIVCLVASQSSHTRAMHISALQSILVRKTVSLPQEPCIKARIDLYV
jgi:hypothetical protein